MACGCVLSTCYLCAEGKGIGGLLVIILSLPRLILIHFLTHYSLAGDNRIPYSGDASR